MRAFKTREDYINATISEKITLVHLSCSTRLYQFLNPSSNVYTKVTPFIVTKVSNYIKINNASVSNGEYYFDIPTMTLYIGSSTPVADNKIIVTYRMFFSDAPVITTFDLEDVSHEVEYEARVTKAPEFKTSLGVNQKGSTFADSGTLELENTDGYFDSLYDTLVFENKEVIVYSWNRQLDPSDRKIIFKGNIYDKSYTSSSVSFQIKNSFTRIEETISLENYTQLDNVSSQYLDNYKRLVYGKVNQMLVRSIDQVADGFELTGDISVFIGANASVTGSGSLFISELSVNDVLEIDSQEFIVKSISSNTSMVISSNTPIYIRGNNTSYSKVSITLKSGTVSSNILTPKIVTGIGTSFLSDFSNGDDVKIDNIRYKIKTVDNNTQLTLEVGVGSEFISSPIYKYETNSLTGDVSFLPPARTVTGTGTIFLQECTQDDVIKIAGSSYTVEEVVDDTTLVIDGEDYLTLNLTNEKAYLIPEIPYREKNRTFLVAGHALKEYETSIVDHQSLNRILVTDTSGLSPGDIISVYDGATLKERATVLRIVDSQITTKLNLSQTYSPGVTIKKEAISAVYIDGSQVFIEDIDNINNTSSGCSFTLSNLAEFNTTFTKNIPYPFQFINGSRTVTLATTSINLSDKIQPRDFIKSMNDAEDAFSDVLRVDDNTITLRSPYQGESRITTLNYRRPSYISDDSSVTVDCIGKTEDNTPSGDFITDGSTLVKDLLIDSGLSDLLDLDSFSEAKQNTTYDIGIAIPKTITSTTLPTIKEIADDIGKTISGSLSINSDLELSYSILDITKPIDRDLPIISFDDLKSWKIKSKSGNLYSEVNVNFNLRDYDNTSKEQDKTVLSISSEFALDFDTSNKTDSIDLYVSSEIDAQELGERYVFYNSLSQNEIVVESDLRLSTISMGTRVILDIPRMYKRLGDSQSTLKICTVVGIDINGKSCTLRLNDLGNLYNRGSVISDDLDLDFSSASEIDRLYASYITDENGSINEEDSSFNINLIF